MAVSRRASSSSFPSSSLSSPSILNYLWIPLLLFFSKELTLAKAAQPSTIRMRTQLDIDSSSSTPSCQSLNPKLNYRPVIGIVSHPGDGASGRLSNATNASYIAASYVKFVEAGGARVIPLIYNEPTEVLFEKLSLVNGVLFTGGWAKTGLYYSIVEKFFEEILKRNDAGEHFPLYAICLGFELVTMVVSKDRNILETYNASNMASTLQFVDNRAIEGTVFQKFPAGLLKKLGIECLVLQNHHYGISPETLLGNPELSSFFKILTTTTDKNDKVYVSTVQAHKYPVTGFQWHPEKNAFEWGLKMIPHSEDAIEATQHAANYLVSEARKSSNKPAARKVLDNLIYNYIPTYGGKAGKGYDEVYIFT